VKKWRAIVSYWLPKKDSAFVSLANGSSPGIEDATNYAPVTAGGGSFQAMTSENRKLKRDRRSFSYDAFMFEEKDTANLFMKSSDGIYTLRQ